MAWTQSDIDRLRRAIATGAKKVEFGDGQTRSLEEFHSLREMLDLLSRMEDEVAGTLAPQRWSVTQYERD